MSQKPDKTTMGVYLALGLVALFALVYAYMQFFGEEEVGMADNPYAENMNMSLPEIPEIDAAVDQFDSKLESLQEEENSSGMALVESDFLTPSPTETDRMQRVIDSLMYELSQCGNQARRSPESRTQRRSSSLSTRQKRNPEPSPVPQTQALVPLEPKRESPKEQENLGFNTTFYQEQEQKEATEDLSLDIQSPPKTLSGFKAILEAKAIQDGDAILVQLQQDIPAYKLKAGTQLMGQCEVLENRVYVNITQAEIEGRIKRIQLISYDPLDGKKGLNLYSSYTTLGGYDQGSQTGEELGGLAENGLNRLAPGVGTVIRTGKNLGRAIKKDRENAEERLFQATIPANKEVVLRFK